MLQKAMFVILMVLAVAVAGQPVLVGQTTSSTRLLVVDLPETAARVLTDSGTQISRFKGQIVFQQTIGSIGVVSTKLDAFNFVGTSVATRRGQTGPLGVSLRRAGSVQISGGTVRAGTELVVHYRLIDKLKGFKRFASDDFSAFTERFTGTYEATLSQASNTDLTSTLIGGRSRFVLTDAVVGAVLGVNVDFPVVPIQSTSPGACAPGLRRLTVQPVYFREGPEDAAPTGRSFEVLRNQAAAIWSKACVTFEFLEPVIYDRGDFKEIGSSEELLDAVNFVPEVLGQDGGLVGIAVLFVTHADFDDWDGGRTYQGGTEHARIVVSDDNIDLIPASNNVLAHEIGHALSLCHPGDLDCIAEAGRNRGTRGTVMCPSGLEADNPDVQSENNAGNVSNPLVLRLALIRCCNRTDCTNNVDCGPCPD